MNVSLGPCLETPCAPGLDGILGNSDDPGIPNKTDIYAGSLRLNEAIGSLNYSRQLEVGLRSPMNLALGAQFRRESYEIVAGELASYVQGGHLDVNGDIAPAGSQVFAGFQPDFAGSHSRTNVGMYADLESELARYFLANVAGRFESYSDFGERLTGKLARRAGSPPVKACIGPARRGIASARARSTSSPFARAALPCSRRIVKAARWASRSTRSRSGAPWPGTRIAGRSERMRSSVRIQPVG